jgi:hypothetical protein
VSFFFDLLVLKRFESEEEEEEQDDVGTFLFMPRGKTAFPVMGAKAGLDPRTTFLPDETGGSFGIILFCIFFLFCLFTCVCLCEKRKQMKEMKN